jgi:hypothetical protein
MPHVKLAGSGAFVAAMGNSVNDERTRAADAFAAIGIERNRFPTALDQPFIHHVEHFQERHVRQNVFGFVRFEPARGGPVFLTPDFESQVHSIYDLRFMIDDLNREGRAGRESAPIINRKS